jgi:hypothetical protein
MRWTKIAVPFLATLLLAYAIIYIYPFAAPLIAHHQTRGIVSIVLNELLMPHPQSQIGQYYPFVLFGVGGAMYFIVSYDLKTRKRSTHGTARPATRSEARKYRAPRKLPTFPRPGRALAAFVGGRAGRTLPFRLRLGWYHGREISLAAQQQYQHLLLTASTGAGKSARVFIPNLLRETGSRSLFIGDLNTASDQKRRSGAAAPTRPGDGTSLATYFIAPGLK